MQFDNPESFVYGAFDLYLNYDGKGSEVGDISVAAQNSDIAKTSVYATVKNNDANTLYILVINKTSETLPANITLNNSFDFTVADVYQLTSASPRPKSAPSLTFQNNALTYQMPPWSASLLVVHP